MSREKYYQNLQKPSIKYFWKITVLRRLALANCSLRHQNKSSGSPLIPAKASWSKKIVSNQKVDHSLIVKRLI